MSKESVMTQRERLSQSEIEAKCLAALRKSIGLKHITQVSVRPYKGSKSWTWELAAVAPEPGGKALKDAMEAIAKLQGTIDLAP